MYSHYVLRLAFGPDGRTLTVLNDNNLRLYDLTARGGPAQRHRVQGRYDAAAYAPDGGTVAAAGTRLVVVDVDSRAERHLPRPDDDPRWRAGALAFAPDGRSVAVAVSQTSVGFTALTAPATVHWYDLATDTWRSPPMAPHADVVRDIAFTPDGRFVVSASMDRTVKFWRRESGELHCALEWHLGGVHTLAFSPDGATLATGSADGTIKLWPWRQLLEA